MWKTPAELHAILMEEAIRDRQTEHTHAPGEEHDDTPDADQPDSTAGEGGVTGGEERWMCTTMDPSTHTDFHCRTA